jgi:polyphenol oxidase
MRLEAASLRDLRGIRHGFYGRQGGVSDGVWSSLNVGLRSGDLPERIASNRALIARDLNTMPSMLVTARQVHGSVAMPVAEPWDNRTAPEADALVTDQPGLLLGVLTADCGPVLLADPRAGVIGAAHAGWKGALGGVLEAVVAAMRALGAVPEQITAAVGPCIGPTSYEVGPEFLDRFVAADPASRRHFDERGIRPRFNLGGFIRTCLERSGVGRIETLPHDTCAEDERFFSFRRATLRRESGFGLQLSGLVLDG